jgi:methionyl-tRNA formyltransferase
VTSSRFRALFFGSPAFAVPSLDAVHAVADVVGVVCQPDKPAGRGLALNPPAVKVRAEQLGLAVMQPTKLRTGEFGEWVRAQRADVALVVAYGRILPADVLAGPRLGCVNVHASLLPRYRGAAPIAWAVVRGERETGISMMKLDEGMDTGAVFATMSTLIGADETAGQLSDRLARAGGDMTGEWLPRFVAGACVLEPQDDAQATMAPILRKEDGRIDWTRTARQVHDHVRGMNPWPGAFTTVLGRTVKVHATRVLDESGTANRVAAAVAPGAVVFADKAMIAVACGTGSVRLESVQPEGKRTMPATAWLAGRGIHEGDRLE